MAQKSGFFNSINGDRNYDASDVARFLKKFFTNGVFNNTLQVSSNDNMTVTVSSGNANIEGYSYENDANLTFDIDEADSTLSRIDSVILRLDLSNRQITAMILQGSYASTPAQPSIVRTGNIYDLRLANISVPAEATRITSAMITDTRFTNDCGNVVGAVQQIDTSNVFAQYESMFNDWFSELEVELDGNVAANLETQILANKRDIDTIKAVYNDVITAYLSENQELAANTSTNDISLIEYNKNGNKFSVSEGKIVIGSGISKVKVSGQVRVQNTHATNNTAMNLYIYKNSSIVSTGRIGSVANNGGTGGIFTLPILIDVEEGDTISIAVWKATGIPVTVSASTNSTYLTVESVA